MNVVNPLLFNRPPVPANRNTKERDPGNTRKDTIRAVPATPAIQPPTSAATPKPKAIIYGPINKVELFKKPKKNRRLTPYEQQTDLEIAKWLRRPVRTFFNDPPFYPWLPPEPLVQFDLVKNFNKGQH